METNIENRHILYKNV